MSTGLTNRLFDFGSFRLDPVRRVLLKDGEPVTISPKAFDLLLMLVENSGRLLTKDELLATVWSGSFVEEANLTQTISVLRKVLGERKSEHRFIVTQPGQGYRFVAQVEQVFDRPATENTELATLVPLEAGLNGNGTARVQVPQQLDGSSPVEDRKALPRTNLVIRNVLLLSGAVVVTILLGVLAKNFLLPSRAEPSSESLAVLPFSNGSGDPETEYLCDGITEILINNLSQLKMRVLASSSVFRYKGQNDPQRVGSELGVEHVLTGKITSRADELIIQAELVRVSDGTQVWGERYEGRLTDMISLQQAITAKAVEALQLNVGEADQLRLAKRQTTNADAQQLYLKARYLWIKRTPDGINKAIEYFEQAIVLDPQYAAAYVGLAEAYAALNHYDPSPSESSFHKARAAAEKAMELDETLAEAHSVLATIKYNYEWDWVGAEKEFQRAIALNPNYATAHHWYAESLMYQGRLEEAGQSIERAYLLDPVSPIINSERAAVLLYKGQTEKAIELYRKVLELESGFTVALYGLGWGLERQGKYDEAIKTYKEMSSITGLACLGYAYAKSGHEDQARAILKQLEEMRQRERSSAYLLAMLHSGLDEKEKALTALENAFEDRDARMALLKIDPHFDGLRSEPRFQQLLRGLRLES